MKEKTNYTPGPWQIGDIDTSSPLGDYAVIDSPNHGAIAEVVWRMEDDVRSPECEANAHLVSAAPELYEALKALQPYGKCVPSVVLLKVEKALKKAEGLHKNITWIVGPYSEFQTLMMYTSNADCRHLTRAEQLMGLENPKIVWLDDWWKHVDNPNELINIVMTRTR